MICLGAFCRDFGAGWSWPATDVRANLFIDFPTLCVQRGNIPNLGERRNKLRSRE
jgi:hypothetical protein